MFSEVAEIARLAQIYLLFGAEIERGNSCRGKVLQFLSQEKLGNNRVPLTRSRSSLRRSFRFLLRMPHRVKNRRTTFRPIICSEIAKAWHPETTAEAGNVTASMVFVHEAVLDADASHARRDDKESIPSRVFDDDTSQRNHEIRQSKIHELIRKQERLLQALQKKTSKPDKDVKVNSF